MKVNNRIVRGMEELGMRIGYDDAVSEGIRMDSDGMCPEFDRGYERGYANGRNKMTGYAGV